MKKRGLDSILFLVGFVLLAGLVFASFTGMVVVDNHQVEFEWNEEWSMNESWVRVSQGATVVDIPIVDVVYDNVVSVDLNDYNLSVGSVYVDLIVNETVVDSVSVDFGIEEVNETNETEIIIEIPDEIEEVIVVPENITEINLTLNITNETVNETEIIVEEEEEEEINIFGAAADSVFSILNALTFNVLNGTMSNFVWNTTSDYVEFSKETEANREFLSSQSVGWVNMTDNIILYHFDNESAFGENSTLVYDFSGNGNNATYNATSGSIPTWITGGKINGSFEFNSEGDHLDLGDIAEMDAPTKFSVAMWFNRYDDLSEDSSHDINNVLVAQSSPVGDDNFELGTDGSRIEFYLDTASDTTGSVDVALQNNTWNHVVFVYDANSTTAERVKIYFNGYKVYSSAIWRNYLDDATTSRMSLGAARPDVNLLEGFFNGSIDEFALWNRSLNADEVLGMYNRQKDVYLDVGSYTSSIFDLSSDMIWQNVTWAGKGVYGIPLPDLQSVETDYNGANMTGNMLLLHMNESSGNMVDSSGNSYTSNLIGSVEYSSTESIFDGSIGFTEDNGYFDLGNDSSLDITSEITMEGWFKPDAGEWGYGYIDSPLRSQYQFDGADGGEPDIVKVYDDVYLVSYYGVSATGWMETLRIKNGYIDGVIDRWNHDPNLYKGRHSGLYNLSNNLSLLIYCNGYTNLMFKVINISSDGMFVGEVDSWTATVGASGFMNSYYLGNDIYGVVLTDDGNDGFVRTFNISSTGTIVKSEIDNFEFNGTLAYAPNMVHVNGTIYAIGYETTGDDGVVDTVEILENGTIIQSVIDRWEFAPATGDDPHIFHVNGSIFGATYRNGAGYVITFEIQPNGSIIETPLNAVTLDSTAVIDSTVTNVTATTFAFFYEGSGSDGLFETMEIQGNGTISDSSKEYYEYDILAGSDFEINYFDGNYYLAYKGENGDGYIATFDFNEDGYAAGAKGETYEYTANNDVVQPKIEHLRDNLFVVLHESPGQYVKLASFQAEDNGSLSTTLDEDTLTGYTWRADNKIIFKVSDSVVATEFARQSGDDGLLQTHEVLDNGSINQIDTLDMGDSMLNTLTDYVYVAGDIYAIAYSGDGTDGWVKTVEIQGNGSIGSSFISSYEFDTTISNDNSIEHIVDNYYGVFYRDTSLDGWVKTLEILDNGTITQSTIASYEFDTVEADGIDSAKLSDKHIAIVYHDSAADGQLMTLSFLENGSVSGTDVYEFDVAMREYPKIKNIVDDYYAVIYSTTTGFNHKAVKTFQISETGSIKYLRAYDITSAIDNQAGIDLAVGERGVMVSTYRGTGNDGFLTSFNVVTDRGFVKPGSYGIDATQSKAYCVLNDSYVTASLTNRDWNHVAMTYDGTTQSLYVNGELKNNATVGGIPTDYYNLTVGKYYTGFMDDLAIYNRSLSADEITAHYVRGALNFNISFKSCNDASCDVEVWEQNLTQPGDLSLTNNRYVQYMVEAWDADRNNPFGMYNITFGYDISNIAPTVDSVNVTSSDANNYSNGTLTGAWNQSDADADALTNQTQWWNGATLNTTFANFVSIESANLTKNETWNFSVRVHDGTEWSSWSANASIILANRLPSVSTVVMNSTNTNNYTNGSLQVSWTFADGDSDSQVLNETKWSKDGVLQSLNNHTAIDDGNLSASEVWNVSVRVFDGQDWGSWSDNVTITIVAIPTVTESTPEFPSGSVSSSNDDDEDDVVVADDVNETEEDLVEDVSEEGGEIKEDLEGEEEDYKGEFGFSSIIDFILDPFEGRIGELYKNYYLPIYRILVFGASYWVYQIVMFFI
jgi:hypothetical protein